MAKQENEKSGLETAGEVIRNGGIIAGVIGVIALAAKSEFAASFLIPGGAVAIITGQGLKMIAENRRKNKK